MKSLVTGLFILLSTLLPPMAAAQSYFQQKADYLIKARLDTLTQKLHVNCTLFYTNNSPNELNYLLLHTWWNAFKDKRSAFSDQLLSTGDRSFFFAKDEDLGGYDELSFEIAGQRIEFEDYHDGERVYSDIKRVNLIDALKSGGQVSLSIAYTLDIPKAFSRPGLNDNLYQLTQWYPKPAVYDREGWHPMPYLHYGEFYSEFGDYEVELTLPISYSLAHTGSLNGDLTDLNIEERTRTETIKAQNIHDFAWFTSEDYIPYTEGIMINDKNVNINLLVKEDYQDWENLFVFAKRSLQFYSEAIGAYPYPQLTIVQSPDENGSGMEYPMLTILATGGEQQKVDHLVNHEIGHNWFYSILASNERRYPWMDEGLTTFFDHEYDKEHYRSANYDNLVPQSLLPEDGEYSLLQYLLLNLQSSGRMKKINLPSDQMDAVTYTASSYEKSALSFNYLKSYLGESLFEDCIRSFYDEWKFKHPQPHDLQMSFEKTAQRNLNWFFEGVINSNKSLDYKLENIGGFNGSDLDITVSNKGELSIPYHLSSYDDNNKLINTKWYEPINNEESQTVNFPSAEFKRISINGEIPFLDSKRKNNHSTKKLNLGLLGTLTDSRAQQLNLLPSVLYNKYDGLMVGLNLYNEFLPQPHFRYWANINYGFSSKDIVGLVNLEKDILVQKDKFRKWTFGVQAQRFNFSESSLGPLVYNKLMPSITAHFSKDIYTNSSLSYKAHIIQTEFTDFDADTGTFVDMQTNVIHQLNYKKSTNKRLSKNDLLIQLEYESYDQPFDETGNYLKLSVDWRKAVYYNESSQFSMRFFGGYFPINSERESSSYHNVFTRGSLALTSQGFTDHTFEHFYIERSGTIEGSSSQIEIAEGGFKNAFGSAFSTGMSNDYLLAANFKVNLPVHIYNYVHFSPYLDVAYSSTKAVNNDPLEGTFFYSGGFALELGKNVGFYFPLVYSDALKVNYGGKSIFARASFNINWDSFNLRKTIDDPSRLF